MEIYAFVIQRHLCFTLENLGLYFIQDCLSSKMIVFEFYEPIQQYKANITYLLSFMCVGTALI